MTEQSEASDNTFHYRALHDLINVVLDGDFEHIESIIMGVANKERLSGNDARATEIFTKIADRIRSHVQFKIKQQMEITESNKNSNCFVTLLEGDDLCKKPLFFPMLKNELERLKQEYMLREVFNDRLRVGHSQNVLLIDPYSEDLVSAFYTQQLAEWLAYQTNLLFVKVGLDLLESPEECHQLINAIAARPSVLYLDLITGDALPTFPGLKDTDTQDQFNKALFLLRLLKEAQIDSGFIVMALNTEEESLERYHLPYFDCVLRVSEIDVYLPNLITKYLTERGCYCPDFQNEITRLAKKLTGYYDRGLLTLADIIKILDASLRETTIDLTCEGRFTPALIEWALEARLACIDAADL